MRYTLTNHITHDTHGYLEERTYYFKDETGRTHIVPAFLWEGGELFAVDIDDIPDFAEWLSHQDIEPPLTEDDYNYGWLDELVIRYYHHREKSVAIK